MTRQRSNEVLRRRRRVAELAAEGVRPCEIAKREKLSQTTVYNDLRRFSRDDLDSDDSNQCSEPLFFDTAEWIEVFEQGFDDLIAGKADRLGPFLVALRVAKAMTLSEASSGSGIDEETVARLEESTSEEQDHRHVWRLLRFYEVPDHWLD